MLCSGNTGISVSCVMAVLAYVDIKSIFFISLLLFRWFVLCGFVFFVVLGSDNTGISVSCVLVVLLCVEVKSIFFSLLLFRWFVLRGFIFLSRCVAFWRYRHFCQLCSGSSVQTPFLCRRE